MTPLFRGGMSLRTLLYYSAIIITAGAIAFYSLFQARFLLSGPIVTFQNIPEPIQTSRVVTLEGSAENIVKIALNGRDIYTDKNGNFKEALILENGYTVATVRAHDRYGRSRTYTHEFVYAPLESLETE